MLGMNSLSDIAKEFKVHRVTLSRRFSRIKSTPKIPRMKKLPTELVLVLDATHIAKKRLLALAFEYCSSQPLAWSFPLRESYTSWKELLEPIQRRFTVFAIVSDGQKGLKKAIQEVFPRVRHQRCIAHVIRLSLSWLTKNPHTEAGKELRILVLDLSRVKTKNEAQIWRTKFMAWDSTHDAFLKEKSENPLTGNRWYTHRKVRAVRSLLKNALPDLFWFTTSTRIPNTTNDVEGGINAPVSEILRRHRGMTIEQKEELLCAFLRARRTKKKSTRNAT
jgi:transposase-like protein